MKETGSIINHMVMEFIFIKMVPNMKAIGKMIYNMEMVKEAFNNYKLFY